MFSLPRTKPPFIGRRARSPVTISTQLIASKQCVRSKTWICGRSLAGIAGSNPSGCMDVCVVCVVCCQVEVSASGRSTVQRSPTDCASEASTMRRSWSTRGAVAPWGNRETMLMAYITTESCLAVLKTASEHDTFQSQDPRNFMFESKLPDVAACRLKERCTY